MAHVLNSFPAFRSVSQSPGASQRIAGRLALPTWESKVEAAVVKNGCVSEVRTSTLQSRDRAVGSSQPDRYLRVGSTGSAATIPEPDRVIFRTTCRSRISLHGPQAAES